jgi:translation initiation factor 2 alpha subunit (eIF-2alpha)
MTQIYQYRWYDDYYDRWATDWREVSSSEINEIREYIKSGKKYQIRILEQVSVEGWGLIDDK